MKVIGITGGSGAGKTTALRALTSFDSLILDADQIYHDLTLHSAALRQDLEARFGAVFDADGTLNRKKLGAIVFADQVALQDLNRITYQYVDGEVVRRLNEAERAGKEIAAIDAIELIGNPLGARCDVLVAISAPMEVRVKRIMAREGISEEYARLRIASQKDEAYFRAHCDYVLESGAEDTTETFSARARDLFRQILEG